MKYERIWLNSFPWRRINPQPRFILTVSPVPLVATMSGSHVSPASIYSKSVLRAPAGRSQATLLMLCIFQPTRSLVVLRHRTGFI